MTLSPRRAALVLAFVPLLLARPAAQADEAPQDLAERVADARAVYLELVGSPDREVPRALLESCKCVRIFPRVLQGAFVFGARHGEGVVTCRDAQGRWSPPALFRLTGGSWGLQLGAQATDLVLFFM